MKKILLCLLLLSHGLLALSQGEALFDKVDACVVSIQHENAGGSGFIISEDGYILTNGHVISLMDRENPKDVAKRITVVLHDESKYQAQVIGFSLDPDVALIKIKPKDKLSIASLADSKTTRTGQECYAFGAPLGLKRTLTKGIISNTAQTSIGTFTKVIQTDAAINPGNSGGPLFNIDGEVIGINTYAKSGSGLGFSIPINFAKTLVQHFKEYGYFKRAETPLIFTKAMTEELARVLKSPRGLFIDFVAPNSPAEKAGFKAGDIIVAMNGEEVDGSSEEAFFDFNWDFVTQRVGDDTSLSVQRRQNDGSYKKITITCQLVEDDPMPASGYQIGELLEINYPEVGMAVQRVTQYVQYIYNFPHMNGVRIAGLTKNKTAAKAGLYRNDFITELNGTKIKNDQNFKDLMDAKLIKQTKFLIFKVKRGNDTLSIPLRVHYPLKKRKILLVHNNDEYHKELIRRIQLSGAETTSVSMINQAITEKEWDGIIISSQQTAPIPGIEVLLTKAAENKTLLGLVGNAPVQLTQAPDFYKTKKFTMDKEKSDIALKADLFYTGKDNEIDGKLISTNAFDNQSIRQFIATFRAMASQAK
ncbi:trypsin-like peptidase domain-containing protein [Lentisphaera marina]|uniref:trypsin-like peptidase domain-containing protein n=1 Tax=Lentisphaera marina TaxID=1111041 RepID=UPI002366A86F|nr:trypsin-like peptidase domain-containing protein [Lentisphaera marina]MDD7985646.1 trypsin-like peptidase domain-containing protein [Lentisphaera marina]